MRWNEPNFWGLGLHGAWVRILSQGNESNFGFVIGCFDSLRVDGNTYEGMGLHHLAVLPSNVVFTSDGASLQMVKKPFHLKLTDDEFDQEDVLILPGLELQTVSRSKRAPFDYCYSNYNNVTYTTVMTCIPVGLALASSAAFLFVFVGAALLLYRPGANSTNHL